ncbi:MAG: AAA family ATPase [Terriglobales bacterium]
MNTLMVSILAADSEQRTHLQRLVESSAVARVAHSSANFPNGTTDANMRKVLDAGPDVVLVDVLPENPAPALHAIEALHAAAPKVFIFAVGAMSPSNLIVAAMRGGACEYLERPANPLKLLEAFARVASARNTSEPGKRGKVLTVVNAKGGSGATTVAVNTALALAATHGSVALVDLAPVGNAFLHLNVKPTFTIVDALRNMHRIDLSLLQGFMTQCENGLSLLAGANQPFALPAAEELARLLDLLVERYRYVVVDTSSRLDEATRAVCNFSENVLLVTQVDTASLWNALQVQTHLSESTGNQKLRLVLNRYRKVSGFSEEELEQATGCKVLWKIQNHYHAVAGSIESGVPVTQENNTEISRSFMRMATALTNEGAARGSATTMAKEENGRRNLFDRLIGMRPFSAASVNT